MASGRNTEHPLAVWNSLYTVLLAQEPALERQTLYRNASSPELFGASGLFPSAVGCAAI